MKTIILIHIISVPFLVSCEGFSASDEIQEFIPGIYVRSTVNEFGTAHDTLIITLQHKEANQYKIINKWKYERVIEGEIIEPEYKLKTTSGIYNSDNKVLQETETLDLFTFDVKKKLLFNGANQYAKIK